VAAPEQVECLRGGRRVSKWIADRNAEIEQENDEVFQP
jgi:hypothetical protein